MKWLHEEAYMERYGEWDYKVRCANDSVCWMNYKKTGVVLGKDEDGIMKVIPWRGGSMYIDSFLVEIPSKNDDFICAFKQPDGRLWAHVVTYKMESNLGIWVVYVFGADDDSYTCHYLTIEKMERDLKKLKSQGIGMIRNSDSEFFYTN
jgi:hypothetical protein